MTPLRSLAGCILTLTALAACSAPEGADVASTELAQTAGEAQIDFARALQSISGFGASSAWTTPDLTDALADQLFSVERGLGLSLLRVRIAPTGMTDELATAQKAVARGARVWASPWSPPGMWKTNGSELNGGSLRPESYQAWADRLAAFAKSMSDRGVPLLVLSAQNEPNWTAEWETCRWTEDELLRFVRDNLGPALARQSVTTKLLGPETIDWNSIRSYGDRLLGDSMAAQYLGAVATHAYGGTAFGYANPASKGKELWQTEWADNGMGADAGIGSALRVAKTLHDHLTISNVSAWHYWWITPRTDVEDPENNPALLQGGQLARRAYAIGNFSKFVRPGAVRVTATASPQTDVFVTAFRHPTSLRIAVVAINQRSSEVSQRFRLSGDAPVSLTPWVTSASAALASRPAVSVSGGAFTFALPGESVTTFEGALPGAPVGGGAGSAGNAGASGASGSAGNGGSGAGGSGAGGSAGVAAAGGAAGSGAMPLPAGAGGTTNVSGAAGGGTSAGAAGAPIGGGAGAEPGGEDSGCACRLGAVRDPRRTNAVAALLAVGAACFAMRRRRVSRAASATPAVPSSSSV